MHWARSTVFNCTHHTHTHTHAQLVRGVRLGGACETNHGTTHYPKCEYMCCTQCGMIPSTSVESCVISHLHYIYVCNIRVQVIHFQNQSVIHPAPPYPPSMLPCTGPPSRWHFKLWSLPAQPRWCAPWRHFGLGQRIRAPAGDTQILFPRIQVELIILLVILIPIILLSVQHPCIQCRLYIFQWSRSHYIFWSQFCSIFSQIEKIYSVIMMF